MLTKYTIQFENRSKTKNVQAFYTWESNLIPSVGMHIYLGSFTNTFCRTLDEPLSETPELFATATCTALYDYGGTIPTYAECTATCRIQDEDYQQTIDLLKRLPDWTFPDAP